MAKKGFFSWFRKDKSTDESKAAEIEAATLAEQEAQRLAELEAEKLEIEKQQQLAKEAEAKAKAEEDAALLEGQLALEAKLALEAQEQAKRQAEAEAQALALKEEQEVQAIEADQMAKEEARLALAAKMKAEAEEQAKLDAEAKQKAAAERLAQIQAEEDLIAAEQERLQAQAIAKAEEDARVAIELAAKIEQEKIAAEKAEQEHLQAQAIAKAEEDARIAAELAAKIEQDRISSEKAEQERLQAQAIAKAEEDARIAAELTAKIEQEKIAAEKAEQERLQAEAIAKAEEDARIAAELAAKIEQDKIAAEKAEQERSQPEPQQKPKKEGFFARLKRGLKRTSENIGSGFIGLFKGKKIDDELFEELEEQLLIADVGVETTNKLIKNLTEHASRKQLKDAEMLYDLLRTELQTTLEPVDIPLVPENANGPFVILMVGVNGVGKTTTIGKLAKQYQQEGRSVMLAAGDTFRAAAVEQLQVWGERNNIPVIAQHTGADSASVLFDALQAAKARNVDVLIADTAGRLQNKSHLMEELKKVVRVMKKLDPDAPHEVMLTLDASTGQNAISQAELFQKAVGVTGISISKLDGTAKGGVIFAIADKFNIPIRYIGVGEQIDDLRKFNAKDFIDALFTIEEKAAEHDKVTAE